MPFPVPRRGAAAFAVVVVFLLAGALALATTVEGDEPPPAAVAGEDRRVECASAEGATVRLDATRSRPGANASDVEYGWFVGYNTTEERHLGDGETLDATLPLGRHEVTLALTFYRNETVTNATDGNTTTLRVLETLTDDVVVEVVDTTAPTLVATASRASLWPPNHKLVPVEVAVQVSDACSPGPAWHLAAATSDEPTDGRGDGRTAPDLLDADVGAQDTSFLLRAERAGPGDGRAYTLTYEARDASGNVARADVVVSVPHDQGA